MHLISGRARSSLLFARGVKKKMSHFRVRKWGVICRWQRQKIWAEMVN